jgi:ribosomal protein S18 acetylase RimI-like enzyme
VENVIIRKMRPADTASIVGIYQAITKQPDIEEFEQVFSEQASRDKEACFVAEHQGRPVGFIISYLMIGSFGIQQSAWTPLFGVHPDYMGHGIGQKLAEAVFDHYKSKGIEHIYTTVRWYDGDVLSFLKTLGFEPSQFVNLKKRLD